MHPDLAAEWSSQNEDLKPDQINELSRRNVWWKCRTCGHEWQAVVKNRVGGAGCPYCSSNRLLSGYNNLVTVYPEIAAEWSDRNLPLKPSEVAPFANRKAWWKCQACGNEWEIPARLQRFGHDASEAGCGMVGAKRRTDSGCGEFSIPSECLVEMQGMRP